MSLSQTIVLEEGMRSVLHLITAITLTGSIIVLRH